MKKSFLAKIMLFILIATLFCSTIVMASDNLALPTSDSESDDSNNTYEFIESDVYKFEQDVVIDDIIDGNAFAFGNNIAISGEIGGDVFAFGNNVTISDKAYIHGTIFVFAQNFTMNGACYDIYSASNTFTLGDTAVVSRDIRVVADNVYINGQVEKNAHITTENLVFPDNAFSLIAGNLEYSATKELDIPDDVVVGDIKYTSVASDEPSVTDTILYYVKNIVSALLFSLAVILLTMWLAPNFTQKASMILKKKAPVSFGIGLLSAIVIACASVILLFITNGLCIGISVASITTLILLLTISTTIFSMAFTNIISNSQKNSKGKFVLMTLLVVLVISLIGLIPYLGTIVKFITTVCGFGIIVFNLINRRNLEKIKTEKAS